MGLSPSQARELSYWEYAALLRRWNDRHDPDRDDAPVEPPAGAFVQARQAALAARGITANSPEGAAP